MVCTELVDEKSVKIEATETLSELTESDMEIILNNRGRWVVAKLVGGERLCIRKSYNFNVGDSVVVIDVTNSPAMKQLGSIRNDNSVQFGDTTDVIRRHFVHVRCRNNITIVNGRKYCDKCKSIVVPRSMCYLSSLSNEMLKNKSLKFGEMLIENIGNKVLLVDMDAVRREENFENMKEGELLENFKKILRD